LILAGAAVNTLARMIIAIVVGALALAALVAGTVVRFVRARNRRVDARIAGDLADAVLGPERRALYMGGTGPYPRTSSNGRITLTRTHLAFRSVIGSDVVVPLAEIREARSEIKAWHTRPVARRPYLEVVTAEGKLAVAVRDSTEWVETLQAALRG
jgi:hypothetical protein